MLQSSFIHIKARDQQTKQATFQLSTFKFSSFSSQVEEQFSLLSKIQNTTFVKWEKKKGKLKKKKVNKLAK